MDKKFITSASLNVILLLLLFITSYGWYHSSLSKCPPCVEVGSKVTMHDTVLVADTTPKKIVAKKITLKKYVVQTTINKADNIDLSSLIPENTEQEPTYDATVMSRLFSGKSFEASLEDTISNGRITGYSFLYTDKHRDTIQYKNTNTTVERPSPKADIFIGVNLYAGGDLKKKEFTGDVAPNISCVIKGKCQVNFTYLPFHKEAGFGVSYKLFTIR